jgi:thiol:disulfide interchange protein DsbD
LLDPDRAFQPQVRRRDLGTAEVKFEVVPGYYLYRDRLRVESVSVPLSSAGGKLKSDAVAAPAALAVSMPHGRMVDDPTFGHVEIFDKTITFTIDLNISPAAGGAAKGGGGKTATKFIVTSQGCAKAGVCFPPQQHVFALPATVSHSREAANAAWVPPVSAATSLGFGRPKLAPEQSSIGK